MIVPIVKTPNNILNTSTKPIKKIDAKIRALVKNMKSTLAAQNDPEGVGLAAPQVGVELSLFVIRSEPKAHFRVFINPVIKKTVESLPAKAGLRRVKKSDNSTLEGCLSIERIWSQVERPKKILLFYQTIDGDQKEEWFSGFEATIIQHEVDHLHGILFTSRALEQNKPIFKETDGDLSKIDLI
ncbi:peptide deformylase [Candidatus Roizmanbacteria bacterium RIFCSPLOWO2_01_FULL_38_12]|uniref:Peptide deformylase n=1 Tax=Candidatus Roizmanbacteria bacterium RIFCSPLOWO2_01_FULL_38_12 TaxID=1802061 RepID=A0A1F7IWN2_9BACT|nr:MAG: peptide deformylase [Candidatus Roizmanbacteria bacterium RIFCSPLOWO2_01_FULL_38_12]